MTAASSKIVLPQSKTVQACETYARFAAVLVCVIGEVVLAAWIGILPERFLPSLAGMPPIAAIGVILAGLGLLCFTYKRIRFLSRTIGLVLALFGLLMLGQAAFGDIGLNTFLIPEEAIPQAQLSHEFSFAQAAPPAPLPVPEGTSPGIVVALILFGVALFYAEHHRVAPSVLSQVLTLVLLAQVLLVVTGAAYGVDMDGDPFPFMRLTVYGVIAFVLLATGLILASPERGIASAILEQSPAGEMLRRLLPGILTVPPVLGWFAREAEVNALYDSAATLVIFAVASIVVLALFAWTALGAVRRADSGRQVALMDLRGQREWLSTTLGSIGDGVIATDPSGSVLLLNRVAEELTGWPAAEARGRPIWVVFRVVDEETRKPVDDPALRALREREVSRMESGAMLLTRDDRELPVEHSGAPIIGQDGSLAGAVLVFRDVTERRRTAQRQTMLVGELNHRVKNALAIVQSLVQASLRQAKDPTTQTMARTLAERLRALHRAHDLLLESQWSGASLKAMVERELEPYKREGGPKVVIKGSDVLLPPQCTSILAMTLHELATNAVKYGALSQNDGQLNVAWKTQRRNRLVLVWEEKGAPLVQKPTARKGFGSQLIDQGIRHNLGGETKTEFRKSGLYVELSVPLTPSNEPRAAPDKVHAPAA
ncbi:sensor histidine kinase [Methyloceanibacter sp. wino2]|uniref:sensor histidine kinase n=1 Tax=Methyloceanibacter sp. wino2 TaxID=2170729 RepID=UPI00131EF506|nr:sensor histidine kinase [Methyloceanibacter sp. wino2]